MSGELVTAKIELFYGGQWHDITADVHDTSPISITRGIANEGGRADPGSVTLLVNNGRSNIEPSVVGRYSARNPRSDLYGLIGRNTPVRVSAALGDNPLSVRAVMEAVSWPVRWDLSGADVWVPLECAGILRRLGTPSQALHSAPRSFVPTAGPVAYWPLEDGSQSVEAASVGGQPPLSLSMVPVAHGLGSTARNTIGMFGSGSLAPWLSPVLLLPQGTDSRMRARITPGSDTGSWVVEIARRWELTTDDPGAASSQIIFYYGGNFRRYIFNWNLAGNFLIHTETDSDGFPVDTKFFLEDEAATRNAFWDNGMHLFRLEVEQDGSNHAWRYYLDGVLRGSGSISGIDPLEPVDQVDITWFASPGEAPVTTRHGQAHIGHLAIWPSVADAPTAETSWQVMLGRTGEPAGRRAHRLCAESDVPFEVVGDLAATVPMGPQRPGTLLDLLDECAAAEAAGGLLPILTEDRDSLGLVFRTRAAHYVTTAPALTLDYSAGHVSPPFEPTEDDQQLANDVTTRRVDGGEARKVDQDGPLGVDTVGRYDKSLPFNVESDNQLPSIAGWALHIGTWDEARYPTIAVNLRGLSTRTGGEALVDDALALDLGDLLRVEDLPEWMPAEDVEQVTLGLSESISQAEWTHHWHGTPAGPLHVFVLGDPVLGRLDTAGSELAMSVDDSATELLVATDTGSRPWITTADRPGDFPFAVKLGGEVVTVTAIVGATSPQTWTVTRATNGISKSHNAGTRVALARVAVP